MQIQHSRPVKWASLGINVSARITLAVSVCLILSALGIFSRTPAAAQPQTQVNLTYLKYDAELGPSLTTTPSTFISPGEASVSVTASFTGRGYGLGLSFLTGGGSGGSGEFLEAPQEAQVSDGDAFIVTPIIDPDLDVLYSLHNDTGVVLTSLTFTLQPTTDLYFYSTRTTNGDALKQFQFSDSVGMTTFNNATREGFRSLTFFGGSISQGAFNDFSFSLHAPDGTPGQSYAAVLSPNGFKSLAFPNTSAPEPGTLMLLLPVGILIGTATRAKWRNRTS